MKRHIWLAVGVALALLNLPSCRQAEEPGKKDTGSAFLEGANEADGSVTASLADGQSITGSDGLPYIQSGPGHFEVKSNAAWQNITATTASVAALGSDKGLKLDLDLTGGSADAPKQYEVTYALDTAPSLKASVWTTKIYIPEVYAAPGLTAYPSLSLYVKTGANWTGVKVVEMSTFALGSGWKTLVLDFGQSTFLVDGSAPADVSADFSQVAGAFGLCPGVTLAFYAEAVDPAMKGSFYLDYLDVSGIALAQVASPVISVSNNVVTITDATADAVIHYTTNGTPPTADSPVYTAPVAISQTTTFQAIALKEGMTASTVTSYEAVYVAGDTSTDPADTTYAFGSDLQGFAMDSYGHGSVTWAAEATGSADGVLRVSRGTTVDKSPVVLFTNSAPLNLTGKTASFRVKLTEAYVTEGKLGIKFFFKNAGWTGFYSWTGVNNGTIVAGWNTITLALDSTVFSGVTASDTNAVNCVGFEFDSNGGTVADDIEVDWLTLK